MATAVKGAGSYKADHSSNPSSRGFQAHAGHICLYQIPTKWQNGGKEIMARPWLISLSLTGGCIHALVEKQNKKGKH